jgi:hypothetical protein
VKRLATLVAAGPLAGITGRASESPDLLGGIASDAAASLHFRLAGRIRLVA